MPTRATSTPLMLPNSAAATSGSTRAPASANPGTLNTPAVAGWLSRTAARVPAKAAVDPTDRSMPPVATTIAMPIATITIGATWVRLMFSVCRVRNPCVKTRLKSSSATSAMEAPESRKALTQDAPGRGRRGALASSATGHRQRAGGRVSARSVGHGIHHVRL